MKVTVCFGNVRVVVPCGDGDILVKDLIREATLRYKKATGKSPDSWVSVHNLQSQGGGILDPDDRLSDVADDREQILASFEDGEGAHHHGGGDGASGSSVGTGSPDLFHDGDKYGPHTYSRTDIEVTGEQIASGVPSLQVRRGSEPTLNQLPVGPPAPSEHTKRWSAAPLILEPPSSGYASPDWLEDPREEEGPGFKRVARDGSNRLSMQFLGDGAGYRWAEAAERAAFSSRPHTSTSLPRETRRKEPLGQANNSTSPTPFQGIEKTELIVIRNQPGPLGIHVVPDYDGTGKDRGLLVQGIEPGGRIDRDGRLAIYDRIVEINGQNLINMPFQRVQEMFKLSLTSPELRLKVVKASGLESLRRPPAPVYPHFQSEDKENAMVECEQKQSTNTKVATVSPTKKVPAISKNLKGLLTANTRKIGRKIEIELTKGPRGLGFSITTRDNPAGGNCPIYIKNIIPEGAAVEDGRLRIGDRLLQVNDEEMTGKSQGEAVAVLRKAPPGSKVRIIVSRQEDVPDNGLPRIIAVEESTDYKDDERHLPDRFNNNHVANDVPPNIPPLPQSHLQALQNRTTPEKGGGGAVAKIVSQFQEVANLGNNPPEKSDANAVFPWKHREILTFNIPVHDSEKAGLGISVKGKTSEACDLGIFIKSVINGGAASRDKRLRTNDQLLNVNGISLLQQSNSDAMETLRKAMLHTEGPVPGNITLTIARRASSPGNSRNNINNRSSESLLNTSGVQELSDPSLNDHSSNNASSGSTNTVIYNPNGQAMQDNLGQPLSPSMMHTWNPVLERLTGKQQLRNESYYKATHDTWSSSMLANSSFGNLTSTTLNATTAEPILIEDEYGSRVVSTHQNSQINIHMTNKPNGIPENRNELHEPDGKASINPLHFDKNPSIPNSSNNFDRNPLTPDKNITPNLSNIVPNLSNYDRSLSNLEKNTDSSSSQNTIVQNVDATYASQLSLENPQGFTRDAFGRQSMSEKRHATLDAKNTDTYQRTKKLREERVKNKETNLVRVGSVESVISVNRTSAEHAEYADKLGQLGPSLGMKKSSSLESLQTMVQEIQMQEEGDPAYSYRGPGGALKVIRGKGCEESFRAAVVDPNHRSEIGAKKHWLTDGPVEEREIDGFSNVRGAPRQSSLNAALDSKNKTVKKKQGIFKGIGSMFRFGKHRKMEIIEPLQHYHHTNEFDSNANVQPNQHHLNQQPNAIQENTSNQHHTESQTVQTGPPSSSERLQNQQQQQENQQHQPQQNQHHLNQRHQQGSHHGQHHQQSPHQQSQQQQNQHQQSQHQPSQHQQNQHPQQIQHQHHPSTSSSSSGSHHHQQYQHSRGDSRDQQQAMREPIYQRHGFLHRHAEQVQVIPENSVMPIPPVKYRQNSLEHKREMHRQRMNQRHTYYQDDRDNIYDQRHAPQKLDQRNDVYGEYGRPGSRSGITESSVPFTHYVNYNELQNHLSRKDPLSDSQIVQMRLQVQQQRLKVEEESRKQHQYHSQRQSRPDNQLRPVSNYYEYESVQSVLNNRGGGVGGGQRQNVMPPTPAQHHQPPPTMYQDVNSNVNQRQPPPTQVHGRQNMARGQQGGQQVVGGGSSSGARGGPFVTQVTIGENKKNGTKV